MSYPFEDLDPTQFERLVVQCARKLFGSGVQALATVRWGINDDLANHPDEVREPARRRREAAAYSQLLDAVACASIQSDPFLCEVLVELAGEIEKDNDYERSIFEHDALHGLLDQVKGALS